MHVASSPDLWTVSCSMCCYGGCCRVAEDLQAPVVLQDLLDHQEMMGQTEKMVCLVALVLRENLANKVLLAHQGTQDQE